MSTEEEYPDRIAQLYADKVLFITGGTGFLGKVLVEKFLRTTKVKRIYLLVRPKKGKDPNQRLREDVFKNKLFDKVKKERGEDIINKVEAIPGDVSELELGLSQENRDLIHNEIEFMFHCAATIRFDEPLKKAVLLNTRGTKLMLELVKGCKKLVAFAHLSTAYCHLHERILYEKCYPPPADPEKVIRTCEWMSEEAIDIITPQILGSFPNSYAFTKALSEGLINQEMDNLPIILLRPSIVIPVWKEPLPGWTDNINGPTGLLIGAGKGVIRTMWCNGDGYGDFLPVDIAVNAILLTTYDFVAFRKRRIYNLTSSQEYQVSWEEMINIGREVINKRMPLNGVVWYPGGSMKKSKILHLICFYLFHIVPAIFIDALLFVLGYKPVLLRVQKRIAKGFEVFEYYANNQWDFNNDEARATRALLNPRERQIYKVDGEGMNYHDYFEDCTHCARLFLLNETDDTIPAAKRHMKV
ncbi:putative fatty acyl-CoA reductase CG5065 isoform X4 [Aethina tumida]|nr:putative fatty acyl-CoA reductase CG5065 isoform X4 [Aethina tumida]XP_049824977.1 putative fatty acyl-CoA reductase CG5065 isoform X4 [Aethina tumida]XP_049824978.1 putative fatty acyl-CoA reductase CG5065 isoform X4 [Aethina tumida]